MNEDVKNTDVHPLLHGYDRHRMVTNTMIGDDCSAEVMEWRPMSNARDDVFPTQLFTLRWTDFVSSDWCEVYESLSQALSRLAVLSACQENDWKIGFRDDERWWGHRWAKWVQEAVS